MSDQLERLQQALADRYVVERELGEGGMATVYLARDIKHDRQVALKVLRPELAAVIGTDRFLQEIKVTANLQHPNIVPLYDSGEADGVLFYVMPSVEGESLRDRLNRERQLPIEDAVQITQAVADALDYAHRRDVVHRDIKPENILLHEGKPLVSDFGIALAVTNVGGERITETGLSLGTPSYMSPEQATGDRSLDARSDIYALGSVLYEMLAGDPPFPGTNAQAVIARILTEKPRSLNTVRDTITSELEVVVQRALSKAAADRFASARAFSDALAHAVFSPMPTPITGVTAAGAPAARQPQIGKWLVMGVPAVVAVAAVAWAVLGRSGAADEAGPGNVRIRPITNFIGWEWSPSWSPDGSMITYAHIVGGDADVATLTTGGGGDPHILTGDSPADEMNPRWSPDGSKIAYISDRGTGSNLYWISPTGGAERKIAETNIPFLERMGAWAWSLGGNPWSPDGQEIVFARLMPSNEVALWKANLESGEQTQLTFPEQGAEDGSASWSFDGRWIVFNRHIAGVRSLYRMPAEGGDAQVIEQNLLVPSQPAWFPDNERVVFTSVRGGAANLWSLNVESGDARQLTFGGGVDQAPTVSRDGRIAYVQFGHQVDLYLAPLDPIQEEHERLTTYTGQNFGARVSPDGERVVYYSDRSGNFDLWLVDRATLQHQQLTNHPRQERLSDWSPGGDEVVFLSDREGTVQLWVVNVETGVTRRLTDHDLPWAAHEAEGQGGPRWAPDGSAIGYLAPGEGGDGLWLVQPDGTGRRMTALRDVLSFSWYRDGEHVIYTRRARDGSGKTEIRAASLESGEDRVLYAGPVAEVTVAANGSTMTFIQSESHFTMDLYMLRLDPPASRAGLPTARGEPVRVTFGQGWHVHSGGMMPDGRGVVYSRDRDFGDIYVIEPADER